MSGRVLRLYRAALWLLPPSFRRAYGSLMAEEARLALADAAGVGRAAVARQAVRLAGDLVAALAREWGAAVACVAPSGRPRVLEDVRLALRSFRRSPSFSLTVILTLALGIGANTAIFSVVDAVLLRPLPYDEPDRLVAVWPGKLFSREIMDAAQDELETVEAVVGFSGAVFTLTEGGTPTELFGLEVTPNHFRALGVRPALGRGFVPADGVPGAAPVAVLSHTLWLERFGGSADVLGRSVELQSEGLARRTVVGVMPAGYSPLQRGAEAWIPVVSDPSVDEYGNSSFMEAFARLKPGVGRGAANAELAAFARRTHEKDPGLISERDVAMAVTVPLAHDRAGSLRSQLLALLGCVGLVLLIACANVANLTLARTLGRTRELGLRRALGAARSRLFTQLLTESVLLGLCGGMIGVGLAYLTRDVLVDLLPGGYRLEDVAIDVRVLAFTVVMSVGAGLLFGVFPALRAARTAASRVAGGTRGGGGDRSSHRLQHGLMARRGGLGPGGRVRGGPADPLGA